MPGCLKNTLLYFGENFDKYRKLEVGYKFFVVDELREKGNVQFGKRKYPEALAYYEKGASILRWVESKPDELLEKLRSMPRGFNGDNDDENNASENKDQINEDDSEEVVRDKKEKKPQSYEERLGDILLTNFSDDNITICEGSLSVENGDREIYENILSGIYMNITVCYLKMNNFKEASLMISEIEKISPKNSLLLFRKAQIIAADLSSDSAALSEAREFTLEAIELKKTEKMYEHNSNFLRIFNLQNHEIIFNELLDFIDSRIAQVQASKKAIIRKIFERQIRIEQVEKDIIARGLVPNDGLEKGLFLFSNPQDYEIKLLKRIKAKYLQIISFLASSEKEEDKKQISIAFKTLSEIKSVIHNFKMCWNLNFETEDKNSIELFNQVNINFGFFN